MGLIHRLDTSKPVASDTYCCHLKSSMKLTKQQASRSFLFAVISLLWLAIGTNQALATSPPNIPVPPSNLQVEFTSFDSARFTWDAPIDTANGRLTGYRLYIDGTFLRQGNFTVYSVGGWFTTDIEYNFEVEAVYESGVTSTRDSVQFTISGFTVSNLRSTLYSQTAAELFWDREEFSGSSLFYEIYRDGNLLSTTTGNSYFDDSLSAGNRYRYEVFIAKSGNRSDSAVAFVQTEGGGIPNGGSDSGSSCTDSISVNNGIISWPDNGWYQVQSSANYTSICEGGSRCNVAAGIYNVINLSTGLRCENIVVETETPDGGDSVGTPEPLGPINTRVQYYSSTAVELFWSNAGENIIATEVYRDNLLLGVSDGTSYYDDTRNENGLHRYSLVAIDANNQLAEAIYVDGRVEQLQISHPNGSSLYETAVSHNQTTLAIGFPQDDNEFGRRAGIVFIYEKTATNEWQLFQELLPPAGIGSGKFGSNVKLDEGLLMVRGYSPLFIDGRTREIEQVYIYTKDSANQWVLAQSLVGTLPDGRIWFKFGDSFDINGDNLFVGSDVNDGYVFVYSRNEQNEWDQVQVLSVDYELGVYGDFGSAVALSGNTALIGAAGSEEVAFNSGSVYVYEQNQFGLWEQQDRLLGSQLEEFSYFGGHIELQGNTAVISTTASDICGGYGVQTGKDVFVFSQDISTGRWTETQRLTSSTVDGDHDSNRFVNSEMFGSSIAFDGETLVIGAAGSDGLAQASGAAYVFKKNTQGLWVERAQLVSSNAHPGAQFGNSVSLSSDTVVVGQFCAGETTNSTVSVFSEISIP